jgi:gluconate 5-dehydrogenase
MMGRNGEEKDIFGISVFLCSDANSYVTGQTVFLDGGFSAA